MTEFVRVGESIEGLKIEGCSRDLLSDMGLCRYKDKDYNRYIASFNVKSRIVSKIPQNIQKIDDAAHCDSKDELTCDKVFIHSLSHKYSSKASSNISARHGANLWRFPKQTNVKITLPHHELQNAISKRETKQLGISKK
jgi:hypothetical protein